MINNTETKRNTNSNNKVSICANHHHFYGSDLVPKSCPTLATPQTVACQVPLSLGFSRQ